jgi:hypothetical protein
LNSENNQIKPIRNDFALGNNQKKPKKTERNRPEFKIEKVRTKQEKCVGEMNPSFGVVYINICLVLQIATNSCACSLKK